MRLDRDKMRWARERLGYSPAAVGERAGASRNSVLRAEHEEDIRPVTARKIAEALGVTVEDLIKESDYPKASAPSPSGPPAEGGPAARGSSVFAEAVITVADNWTHTLEDSQLDQQQAFGIAKAARDLEEQLNSYVADPGAWGRLSTQEQSDIARATNRLEAVDVLYRRVHTDDLLQRAAALAEVEKNVEESKSRIDA